MRSFIGITGHYFSVEWKLQHIMLACNRIRGRHTAENIVMWFDEVISDFHIAEQIKHIVTDSGSNVKKAFLSRPGYEGDEVEDQDSSSISEGEMDSEESEPTGYSLEGLCFEHNACFAHTLQLVVKDRMKKVGGSNQQRAQAMFKASCLCAKVYYCYLREKTGCKVTMLHGGIRIKSVLAIPESNLSLLECAPSITTRDQNILKDIVFEVATDFVQVTCVP